jgi:hypothetical protein
MGVDTRCGEAASPINGETILRPRRAVLSEHTPKRSLSLLSMWYSGRFDVTLAREDMRRPGAYEEIGDKLCPWHDPPSYS